MLWPYWKWPKSPSQFNKQKKGHLILLNEKEKLKGKNKVFVLFKYMQFHIKDNDSV